jgi:hypothetical protein
VILPPHRVLAVCPSPYGAHPQPLYTAPSLGLSRYPDDFEAYKLYREPAEYFFNRSLHVYPGFTDAPGYITEASVRARYKSQVRQVARSKQMKHDLTWDEMVAPGCLAP